MRPVAPGVGRCATLARSVAACGPACGRGRSGRPGPWAAGRALLAAAWLCLLLAALVHPSRVLQGQEVPKLRVQLLWYHQAQFAGFYMAQLRQRFAEQGIAVELIEGGPGVEPLDALQSGRADVAVAWYYAAYQRAEATRPPIVNVAQVFDAPTLALACRPSAGVHALRDLPGKTIGTWHLGDEIVLREMLVRAGVNPALVALEGQQAHGQDLIDGRVACATVMMYNEFWRVLQDGVPAEDLVIFDPAAYGVRQIEDGLYVLRGRLADRAFVAALERLLRGLREGWKDARTSPTISVEAVLRLHPQADRNHQRRMLETILPVIPQSDSFGLQDLGQVEQAEAIYAATMAPAGPSAAGQRRAAPVWTHAIWHAVGGDAGRSLVTEATKHYLRRIVESRGFRLLLLVGCATFALPGLLEAVERGYDFWGRLILAFLSALGGGTLRDVLIAGPRLPPFYMHDAAYPVTVFAVAVLGSLTVWVFPDWPRTALFRRTKAFTDMIGFSVLTVAGASIGVLADLAWFWIPACAALTCAGGGMRRDIVVNREPRTFMGVIYEETAIAGALLLTAGLLVANRFEHRPGMVGAALALTLLAVFAARWAVWRYDLRMPGFSPRD